MKRGYSWWASKRTRRSVGDLIVYAILILICIAMAIPFFWMISTSLKEKGAVFTFPPQWIPDPIVWHNFPEALTMFPFQIYFKNTILLTLSCILGTLLSSSLVAYSFARLRFPGRNFLFLLLLSTIMLPYQVTMIPTYILFRYLGWIDTFKPLIVPAYFGGAFNIFLLRQFFLTIPLELDDAARIDGCSSFDVYWRINLPLAKPALLTVSIFAFMFHWNDLMGPLIYINSGSKWTLSLGLVGFRNRYFVPDWNLLMAASLATILPCLIVFFFAQKYFIQGIATTGLKG